MMAWTVRQHRLATAPGAHEDDVLYATNGGSTYLKVLGIVVVVISGTGIVIEGVGGVLMLGNFWFQLSHIASYGGFALAGVVCVLESVRRVPFDSWRVFMALAFAAEGAIFYGHQLEQRMTEQALHFIIVLLSEATAFAFFWATRDRASVFWHVVALAGMMAKGLWFFVAVEVLYSGKYGVDGVDLMVGDVYAAGCLLVMLVAVVYGSFFVRRPSLDAATHASEFGWVTGTEAKYDKVVTQP